MPNVVGKDLPAGQPLQERGKFPKEFIFGAKDRNGSPDPEHAQAMAHNVSLAAYLMGFDVEVLPREVGGQLVPGDFVVKIMRPESGASDG